MQPRIENLNSFADHLQKNLKIFLKMIKYGNGKIYLVTSDAECTKNIILNIMSLYTLNCTIVTRSMVKNVGDLSSFLYSHVSREMKRSLVLDFTDICVGETTLGDSELRLLEEINANRDIFIKHFCNTIIIFPNGMSYWLQAMARDIFSCISFHLNMANWFIIPEDIPIFHITLPYVSSSALNGIDNFEMVSRYNKLKKDILSLTKYEPGIERFFLERIYTIDEAYKSELFCLLLRRISVIPTTSIFARKRVIETWDYNPMNYISTAQAHCYVGEFWYINGEFLKAFSHFKDALKIIVSESKKDLGIYIQLYVYQQLLVYNQMLCILQGKSKSSYRDVFNLLKRLSESLEGLISENCDNIIKMYAESYLFIYKICLGNCNYITLLDLCEFEESRKGENDYANVNIYKNMLMWVNYIVKEKFEIPENLDILNPWTQLHITTITMIQNFRIGNYFDTTYFFRKAKDRINKLGHMQMQSILKTIRKNMLFLIDLEKKSFDITTLEGFIGLIG